MAGCDDVDEELGHVLDLVLLLNSETVDERISP